jgi:hypothetical protein
MRSHAGDRRRTRGVKSPRVVAGTWTRYPYYASNWFSPIGRAFSEFSAGLTKVDRLCSVIRYDESLRPDDVGFTLEGRDEISASDGDFHGCMDVWHDIGAVFGTCCRIAPG